MKFKVTYFDPKGDITDWKHYEFYSLSEDDGIKHFQQRFSEMKFLSINEITEPRTFDSGAMRGSNEGKENYIGAISWTALKRVSLYQNNAEKKGGYNKGHWKKGIPIEEYEKSLMRHLQKYFANKYENANLEPEVDHLAAAYFNLQGILHEEEKINTSNSKEN